MAHLLTESSADRRVYLLLLGLFAGIALVIATAGIYGTSAYAVACRTQEMGIRIALGATRGQILALVLRRGMALTLVGVAAGIVGSLTVTKVIAGILYGVTPTDASTFVGIALLFASVALLATYIPARRAATMDPTIAFRSE
jgi:putative ABC transport system permease protein